MRLTLVFHEYGNGLGLCVVICFGFNGAEPSGLSAP